MTDETKPASLIARPVARGRSVHVPRPGGAKGETTALRPGEIFKGPADEVARLTKLGFLVNPAAAPSPEADGVRLSSADGVNIRQ